MMLHHQFLTRNCAKISSFNKGPVKTKMEPALWLSQALEKVRLFFFYPLHGKQHHHGAHAFLIYRRNYNHNPPFLVSILNGIILYIIDVAVCLSLHFPFACENVLLSFFEYLIWNKIWRLWSIRKITQFSSAVIAPLLDMEHRDSCPSGPSKYHAAPQLCNT